MKEQTLVFNLSEALEYAKAGSTETTFSLEIVPPAPNHHGVVMSLAQKVMRAMFDARKLTADTEPGENNGADEPDADAKMTPEFVRMMLLGSSIPFDDFLVPFFKILEKTCTMDGELQITQAIWDRLPIKDKNNLLFEYVANFIIPLIS